MRDTLQTERLTLRPFALGDAHDVARHANDIAVARQLATLPHPYDLGMAKDWVRMTEDRTALRAYALEHAGEVIGSLALTLSNGVWDLGYWLGQSHWHQGFMREAASAVVTDAAQDLTIPHLSASCFTDNPRSAALLLALGFEQAEQTEPVFCVARNKSVPAHKFRWERPAAEVSQ